ncbi:MAG TPA: GNAT family N-acetyltransferase [Candidatus Faecalibacterium faecigallinarum]|uniref:GNAT family N-acetyltransferase n=1 Tax=Candidatus Faecalibacterium faecigallinarum TaxID=2838577 RepID=A0A9D2P884_9FIRM|nr:GNAT family N-acetyltransferase [Candidatus Faecalibacterium faecigallinarum]
MPEGCGGAPTLRPYRPEDCPALAHLFYETVHAACTADYTPAQLEAWAPGSGPDLAAWDASFQAHTTLVAEIGGRLAGFGDLDPAAGYLDRLYVRREFQRRGVASALCDALEQASRARPLTTHASRTARPFFEKRGYRVLRSQQVERRGQQLENFVMEKP